MDVIQITNLIKIFKFQNERRDSLRENLFKIFSRPKYEKFSAIDCLDLNVKKGEFFGIIGRNGSGKSTLLKILAGIYIPSSGSVCVNGHVAPFLELGVGFNGELSGRENIFLNGSIMGLSEKEIRDRYDDIVAFSELERFIDQKLKNYSSGMQLRLAFAIAIQSDADIFLLDEVLAVGDSAFQMKCFDKFREFKAAGKTIVLVTHDLELIRRFCDRVLYLGEGKQIAIGSTNEVLDKYINDFHEG